MDTGTIGFHNQKAVLRVKVEKDKEEIKRVSKTKAEATPDLAAERGARDAEDRRQKKKAAQEKRIADKAEEAKRKAEAEER